jgi:MFS family permease
VKKNRFSELRQTFGTFRYRNYRLFFTGQSISLIGTWIQIIALNWLVYSITNSPFMLGLVGFLSRIPTLILAPFMGVIADRFNRYKLLMITQILAMVQAGILAALVLSGTIQVWQIIILGLIGGIINSLDIPVRQAFIVEMVEDKKDLSNAIVLNSFLINIARFFGPTIAGIMVATVGEGWCFTINAISFVAIIWSLLAMKLNKIEVTENKKADSKNLKEGFLYAWKYMPIRTVLLLLSLVSLMGMPFQVLMPVFAKDILHGGPHTLGYLMAGISVGALAGGMFLSSKKKSALLISKYIAAAAIVFGSGLVLFSLSGNFYLSFFMLAVTGLGMMIQITSSNTFIQTVVDDDKRGRVMGFYTMAFMGTVPLGNLLSGFLASAFGVVYTVMIGGAASILGALIFYTKLPAIRKLIGNI